LIQEGVKKAPQRRFHSLYRSPNIVGVIKSRRLRWTGHLGRIEEDSAFKILTNLKEGNP
jgi:hypothetical protein